MAGGTGARRRWRGVEVHGSRGRDPEMLKYLLATAALVVAGVPAAVGLAGNASFTRDLPVRVPEQAQTTTPTSAPTASDDGTADQGRGEVEPGDDHGGDVPRDARTEAGDDRDHSSGSSGHHAEPGDDHGGTRGHDGSDDDATHDATDDHGGTSGHDGSDDATDDHSGSGGSGSGGGSDDSGSGGSGGSDDGGHHGGGSDDGSGHS
jgi:hypothetical protein